ncbi:MAG: protoheme IX farnesyltransferase [Chloroflexi bacterium]|nr:protoheme IX farnesyltransferase [Chloroflexota bacterium]
MSSTSCARVVGNETSKAVTLVGARFEALRTWATLVKPRIVALVVLTAVIACVTAAKGAPPLATVLIVAVSGALASGGAAALNHYFDRDLDRHMERTRRRPLVTGQIRRPTDVLVGGLALVMAGTFLALAVNPALAAFELAGAAVYAGVYTLWLKRRTPLNIVIGGAAGSAAVLGGWAAIEPRLGLAPWLLAALVFVWTPAHFWSLALARAEEYRRVEVPMLPVLVGSRCAAGWIAAHAAATVAISVWFGLATGSGVVYWTLAGAAGLVWLVSALRLLRAPEPAQAWQTFKLSGPYLGLTFLAILFDTIGR